MTVAILANSHVRRVTVWVQTKTVGRVFGLARDQRGAEEDAEHDGQRDAQVDDIDDRAVAAEEVADEIATCRWPCSCGSRRRRGAPCARR